MGNKQGATFNDETIAEFSKISGMTENQVITSPIIMLIE